MHNKNNSKLLVRQQGLNINVKTNVLFCGVEGFACGHPPGPREHAKIELNIPGGRGTKSPSLVS